MALTKLEELRKKLIAELKIDIDTGKDDKDDKKSSKDDEEDDKDSSDDSGDDKDSSNDNDSDESDDKEDDSKDDDKKSFGGSKDQVSVKEDVINLLSNISENKDSTDLISSILMTKIASNIEEMKIEIMGEAISPGQQRDWNKKTDKKTPDMTALHRRVRDEGSTAGFTNKPIADNPYKEGHEFHGIWKNAHVAARKSIQHKSAYKAAYPKEAYTDSNHPQHAEARASKKEFDEDR